jgi:fluoroquinolone resistance protein
MELIENHTFTSKDLKENSLKIAQYELCVFNNIDFKGFNLSESKFVECDFVDCDLSLVSLTGSMFQVVHFKRCKMLGLFFETVKPFLFQVRFDNCNLESSSFAGVNLERTIFAECKLVGVDFTEANVSKGIFNECDLLNATFLNTNLTKTNLQTAHNFSIDIRSNQVNKAVVSNTNLEGFLNGAGLDVRN